MSDPGSQPPVPPPPPNLAPPPGYVAYQPSPSAAVPLRRVGGLRTAIIVLLAVYAVGAVIQIIGTPSIVDSARDLLAERISDDDFLDDYTTYNLSGLVTGAAQIALVVLTMIWLFRIAKNHQTLGRRLTWGAGWAIGGWFVPPLLYIIPLLMLRETWKAADPDVPPGDDRWRSGPEAPQLWVWWVLFGLAPIVFLIIGLRTQFDVVGGDAEDLAESLEDRLGLLIAQSVVNILAAGAWALVVRALTDRHARLTGEATARR